MGGELSRIEREIKSLDNKYEINEDGTISFK